MVFLDRFARVPWNTECTKMDSKINSVTFLNETAFPNVVVSKLLLTSFLFFLEILLTQCIRSVQKRHKFQNSVFLTEIERKQYKNRYMYIIYTNICKQVFSWLNVKSQISWSQQKSVEVIFLKCSSWLYLLWLTQSGRPSPCLTGKNTNWACFR